MQWITILLIGVAANLDNLGISVSYGLKSNKIPMFFNLIISIISMICAYISIIAGSYLSSYFSQSMANYIGGSLIIGLGVWLVIASYVKKDSNQTDVAHLSGFPSIDKTRAITWKESIILGFILAFNCLTIGFGAGITGVSPILTAISIGIFSMISISLGVKVGNKIGNTIIGNYSNTIAGLLLIIIGIHELF